MNTYFQEAFDWLESNSASASGVSRVSGVSDPPSVWNETPPIPSGVSHESIKESVSLRRQGDVETLKHPFSVKPQPFGKAEVHAALKKIAGLYPSGVFRVFTDEDWKRAEEMDDLLNQAMLCEDAWALTETIKIWERAWRKLFEKGERRCREELSQPPSPASTLVQCWSVEKVAEALEAGDAVTIWSATIGEWIYWVKSELDKERIESRGRGVVVYTLGELETITREKWTTDHLKAVHTAKRELGGTIQKPPGIVKREREGKPSQWGGG